VESSELILEIIFYYNNEERYKIITTRGDNLSLKFEIFSPTVLLITLESKVVSFTLGITSFFFLSGGLTLVTLLKNIAYLDPSGIEAPTERVRYFWDSSEFGRRLRENYRKNVDNPYHIYNHRILSKKIIEFDPREQFLTNVLRKR